MLPEVTEAIDGDIAPLLVMDGDVSTSSASLLMLGTLCLCCLGLGSAVEGVCVEDTSSAEARVASCSEYLRSSNRSIWQ